TISFDNLILHLDLLPLLVVLRDCRSVLRRRRSLISAQSLSVSENGPNTCSDVYCGNKTTIVEDFRCVWPKWAWLTVHITVAEHFSHGYHMFSFSDKGITTVGSQQIVNY